MTAIDRILPIRAVVSIALATTTWVATATVATARPDAPAKGAEPAWKKLFNGKTLEGWTASDFYQPGKVHAKDGVIMMEAGSSMTGVTYAGKDFPKTNYEVAFEAKKVSGNDFFCTTTFPVGDEHCSFVVGGWGGTMVGLSSINGQDASENETSTSKEFARDKWYRVRIRVAKERIQTWIDDEKVVDFDAADSKLSIRIECRPSRPFGICTWKTTGAVRDVKLRLLTDAEKKAAAEKKPATN